MKVGDYVRVFQQTMRQSVGITKLVEETDDYWFFGNLTIPKRPDKRSKKLTDINNYVMESSSDILDLIYPGDLLYIDISPDDCGGIVVPRTTETQNEVDGYKEKIRSGEYILKGILTREQIKHNYYWLEEDCHEKE